MNFIGSYIYISVPLFSSASWIFIAQLISTITTTNDRKERMSSHVSKSECFYSLLFFTWLYIFYSSDYYETSTCSFFYVHFCHPTKQCFVLFPFRSVSFLGNIYIFCCTKTEAIHVKWMQKEKEVGKSKERLHLWSK